MGGNALDDFIEQLLKEPYSEENSLLVDKLTVLKDTIEHLRMDNHVDA